MQAAAASALEKAEAVEAAAAAGDFDGEDGVSPTAAVTDISGGHRLSVTDVNGTTTVDVMDGVDGEDGEDGLNGAGAYIDEDGYIHIIPGSAGTGVPPGGTTGQVLKKATNSDYETEWASEGTGVPAGGTTGQYLKKKSNTDGDVEWGTLSVPSAATATPSDLGTAAVGSSSKYAKEDHVHKMPSASDVGAYALPSGGIPSADLASGVQTSLGKADTAYQKPSGGIPAADLASGVIPTVPAKTSDLTNDSGFITTETDPTVPSWAKQSTKPSYTASEVGAIVAPSSPATGSFLVWDGLAWVAQTLSTWQGGSY